MKWPKLQKTLPFLLAAVLAGAMAWHRGVFINWNLNAFIVTSIVTPLVFLALAASVIWPGKAKPGWKCLQILAWLAAFIAVEQGVPYYVNIVKYNAGGAGPAMRAMLPLLAALVISLLFLFLRGTGMLSKKLGAALLGGSLAVTAFIGVWGFVKPDPVLKTLGRMDIYENSVEDALPQGLVHGIVLEHFSMERIDGKTPKCLIVGYDGARADALVNIAEGESGILALKAAGGGVYQAYTGGDGNKQDTSTAPGWTTMLTGHWAEEPGGAGHGVVSNGVNKTLEPGLIFTQILEQRLAKGTSFIVSWGGHFVGENASYAADMAYCGEKGLNAAWFTMSDDAETLAQALGEIEADDCADMVMCILEHCDHTGHASGFENKNPDYVKAFRDSDREALALIDAVKARAEYDSEDWLIVIASDHGGDGTGHGGQAASCRQVFIALNKPI